MKLFNIIFVVMLLCTNVSNTFAQLAIRAGFNMSIFNKQGFNSPGMILKPDYTYGGQFGLTYEFPLKNNFAIETGVIATMKGLRLKTDIVIDLGFAIIGGKTESETKLYYTEIPLLFKKYIPLKSEKIRLYFTAGPYVALGVYGNSEITYFKELEEDETERKDIKWGDGPEGDYVRRIDCGFIVGSGLTFGKFFVEGNYSLGLIDVFYESSLDEDSKNRVISIVTGFRF